MPSSTVPPADSRPPQGPELDAFAALSGDLYAQLDAVGRLRRYSRTFIDLTGRPSTGLTGLPLAELVDPADRPRAHALVFDAADRPSSAVLRLRVAHGASIPFEFRVVRELERIHLVGRDVTQRLAAAEVQHEREELFRHLFEEAPTGMALARLGDQRLSRVNRAFARALGYEPADLLGRTLRDFTHPDDVDTHAALDVKLLAGEIPSFQLEKRYLRKDGSVMHGLLQVGLLRDQAGTPLFIVGQVLDISERKRVEAALEHAATHDALTGLPNGRLFRELLARALLISKRTSEPYAVLYLDLDRFKVVNDSLGHAVGDELLIAVAARLKAAIRASDAVARHGGDEFTILLSPPADLDDCVRVAERIVATLSDPVLVGGREVVPGASIGIALSRPTYATPEEPLRDADTAMYRAKGMGGGQVAVFDSAMHARMVSVFSLENELRAGLHRNEFEPYFQPIVDLSTGRIVGFESLIRWNHPTRGVLAPGAFLQVAEDTGLVVQMGRQALSGVVQVMTDWLLRYGPERLPWVSVNLSNRQFQQPDLVTSIVSETQLAGLPHEKIHLEITEGVVMTDTEVAARVLTQLRRAGFKLDVDDFGTGYSSLAALDRFPIDALKIDQSFVRREGGKHPLVAAIVNVGQLLGLKTIAEGIENADQLAALRALGCEFGQGYLFSRPVNAADALQLLERDPQW